MSKEIAEDAVVEANREMLLQRSIIGINKYGVTLEKSGLNERQLVVHALEEALDLANYLQAQLMRIDAQSKARAAEQDFVHPCPQAFTKEIEGEFILPIIPTPPCDGKISDECQREEQARNAKIAGTQAPIFDPTKPFKTKDSMP